MEYSHSALEYWQQSGDFGYWAANERWSEEVATITEIKSLLRHGFHDLRTGCEKLCEIYRKNTSRLAEFSDAAAEMNCPNLSNFVLQPKEAATLAEWIEAELGAPENQKKWLDLTMHKISIREKFIIAAFTRSYSTGGPTEGHYDPSSVSGEDHSHEVTFTSNYEDITAEDIVVVEKPPRRFNTSFTRIRVDPQEGGEWRNVTDFDESEWDPVPGFDEYTERGDTWKTATQEDLLPKVWISMPEGHTGYITAPAFINFMSEMTGISRQKLLRLVRSTETTDIDDYGTLTGDNEGWKFTVSAGKWEEWRRSPILSARAETLGWMTAWQNAQPARQRRTSTDESVAGRHRDRGQESSRKRRNAQSDHSRPRQDKSKQPPQTASTDSLLLHSDRVAKPDPPANSDALVILSDGQAVTNRAYKQNLIAEQVRKPDPMFSTLPMYGTTTHGPQYRWSELCKLLKSYNWNPEPVRDKLIQEWLKNPGKEREPERLIPYEQVDVALQLRVEGNNVEWIFMDAANVTEFQIRNEEKIRKVGEKIGVSATLIEYEKTLIVDPTLAQQQAMEVAAKIAKGNIRRGTIKSKKSFPRRSTYIEVTMEDSKPPSEDLIRRAKKCGFSLRQA